MEDGRRVLADRVYVNEINTARRDRRVLYDGKSVQARYRRRHHHL